MKTTLQQLAIYLSLIQAALLSGLLLGFAYPLWLNVPTGILAWFALVPLLLSLRDATSFKVYTLSVVIFLSISTGILGQFVMYSGILNGVLSILSEILIVFVGFAVHYLFQKQFGWRRSLFALPFILTFTDWLHHIIPHSFQVTSFAHTQTTVIWFAQIADVFGQWGIAFWVVLVNVSLALVMDNLQSLTQNCPYCTATTTPFDAILLSKIYDVVRFFKKWAIQGSLLFGLPLMYAFWVQLHLPNEKSVKVALVQTNENSYAKVDSIAFNQRIERVIRLTNEAVKTQPDLLVVPESALPIPVLSNKNAFDLVRYYVSQWNTSLAVGFQEFPDSTNRTSLYNSAFVFTPQLANEWDKLGRSMNQLKVYRKQNPLPVMEYMPYAEALGFKGILGVFGGNILRGSKAQVFSFPSQSTDVINRQASTDAINRQASTDAINRQASRDAINRQASRDAINRVSTTICWEQFFPNTQAELVASGAQFLCQMNNDGWFGTSAGQALLCNMNRLRAIENRRTVARCSNTGISTFIDPFGRLYGTLPTNTEAKGVGEVYLNSELTFFTQYKSWFPKVCGLVTLGLFVFWRSRNF